MSTASLYERNLGLAINIAREYRQMPGMEYQDIEQEARIGLWIACRAHDRQRKFSAFASVVIHRRLIQLLRTATALKHRPLNHAQRWGVNDRGEQIQIVDLLEGGRDPADLVVARETWERLCAATQTLTPLEHVALEQVLTDRYDSHVRNVENANRRMKDKLKAAVA